MPGGRLTQQERQQIALGLADGLAYAEIARRLGRPTSTITREVMRNGGPTAYRAELAHRATEHRAHRRRKAAPGDPGTSPQAHGRDAEAVRAYEETFTTVFMQSGLPKMTARVLVNLYTTDAGSLTAAELAAGLRISPASVSKAVTFLESQGLIRRERDERRRERYIVDNDVMYQSTMAERPIDRPPRRGRPAGRRRPRPRHPGRRPPGEHRPLRRLRRREHRPRRGPGPRDPPHQTGQHDSLSPVGSSHPQPNG